ncbi:MAG: ATP-binding protein [Chloroflexi bacterium]|nr:ATP-binding protein [Chloroflexota bacterium]
MTEYFRFVDNWTEEDLLTLPQGETEYFEYKSSKTPLDKLKDKISIAASAFWNSGGGIFIAGVNNSGKIDGGIPANVARQSIRDWVDQILASVEPVGSYSTKIISKETQNSLIQDNCVVLVVSFGASIIAPHMAYDKKYYVRAGTHSGPASHFLVEAIRGLRGLQKPMLRGLLKMHDEKSHIVELVILALNQPALNVELSFEPLPKIFSEHTAFGDKFPLHIPVIERNYPFRMDISMFPGGKQVFGDNPVRLKLNYQSVTGENFSEEQILDPSSNMPPMQSGKKTLDEIEDILKELTRHVKSIASKND